MIEAVLGFFALWTIGFWLLLVATSIVIIALNENEHHVWPATILVILIMAYWKQLHSLDFDWRYILVGVAIYAAIGVAWSIHRWFRFVKNVADDYRRNYGDQLNEAELENLQHKLSVNHNKSEITAWIAYWPWSLLWNFVGDFFTMLFESVQKVYQRIVDNALGSFRLEEPKAKTGK